MDVIEDAPTIACFNFNSVEISNLNPHPVTAFLLVAVNERMLLGDCLRHAFMDKCVRNSAQVLAGKFLR